MTIAAVRCVEGRQVLVRIVQVRIETVLHLSQDARAAAALSGRVRWHRLGIERRGGAVGGYGLRPIVIVHQRVGLLLSEGVG
ncbi:hypothetical protein [Burkholderia sp. Tr-862]|uniref:hypothetical protein n=1 Tax=Burkholderia sp. Tr-862 TaxID=2608331 RepID=UPI001FFD19FC|nr:hypothetical protein [Burkholderia sp. Tr-862]